MQRASAFSQRPVARVPVRVRQPWVAIFPAAGCAEQLLAQFEGRAKASHAPERGRMDLRTYGVGAQILRECGVHRMLLLGTPRRLPSMAGYGLEIAGYVAPTPVN